MAFILAMVQGDQLFAEYIGLDYQVALDLHLYHYAVRDLTSWAIANGYKHLRSSGLNYDPKLHMRHRRWTRSISMSATLRRWSTRSSSGSCPWSSQPATIRS